MYLIAWHTGTRVNWFCLLSEDSEKLSVDGRYVIKLMKRYKLKTVHRSKRDSFDIAPGYAIKQVVNYYKFFELIPHGNQK